MSEDQGKILMTLPKNSRGEKGRRLCRDLAHRITQQEEQWVTMGECLVRGLELLDAATKQRKPRRKRA